MYCDSSTIVGYPELLDIRYTGVLVRVSIVIKRHYGHGNSYKGIVVAHLQF